MALLSLDRGLIPLGAIASGFLAEGIGVRPGLFVMGATIVGLSLMEVACEAVVGVGVAVPYGAPGYGHYGPYGGGVLVAGGPVVRY